jgi:hypothetical protein
MVPAVRKRARLSPPRSLTPSNRRFEILVPAESE